MSIISGLFSHLHWPLCRAYARFLLRDEPAGHIFRLMISLQFWNVHRFWPNFLNPKRFSEKVWSRMLHARDPRLTLLNDKFRVRSYVAELLGADYLIPLLWSGNDPEDVPFDNLPIQFVIKANHGCNYLIIAKDKHKLNQPRTRMRLRSWLSENYCEDHGLGIEWGYKHIKPLIFIEEFLGENGRVPVDYKFWCFNGLTECVTLHFDRFGKHTTQSYNRNFEPIEFGFHLGIHRGQNKPPSNYREMINVAETLSAGFDFLRVDLYNHRNRIFFGELTPYPGGVTAQFLPTAWDCYLGERWK
jgi:hypothetical protein